MSTTVSYKGATIATVSNQTKTLLTEGKYLEDDITLTDVSGGGATLITKNITANGTYNASSDSADGYSQVTVDVHGLQELTYSNGYIDCSGASVNIASPSSSNNYKYLVDSCVQGDKYLVNGTGANAARSWCFAASDGTVLSVKPTTTYIADNEVAEAPASAVYFISNYKIDASANPYCYKFVLTEEDVKSISANGTYTALDDDLYGYAQVNVNVPNSYSAGDEGKVVSNGALVAQTSDTVTTNDTYDTTLINSLTVNVSGGGGLSWDDFSDYSKPSGECVYTGNEVPPYFAFRRTGLTSFTGNNVTSFGAYGGQRNSFIGCTSLESVSFANYSGTIYSSLFSNCSSLETVSFPKAVTVEGNYVFNGCASLVGIVLPSLNGRISSQYFVDSVCVAFKYLDIGCTQTIYGIMQNAFNGASNFDTLIIRGTSVNTLANINAFSNTKFASGGSGGTLYVPSSLMSNYQSASNWSTIIGYANNQIKAIEGSYYETHYADGTVIS